MDRTAFLKAKARLEAFKQNLPGGSIEEIYVREYHEILDKIEAQTGEDLDDFRIPGSQLAARPTSGSRSGRYGTGPIVWNYSKERYCTHDFFAIKLDGVLNFVNYMTPSKA
jgi:hypothetical protein